MGNRKQHGKPPRGKSGNPDRRSAAGKPDEEKTTADYYRLKTEAVEDLVTANEENSPPVSAAEPRKYRSGPQIKLADWVKVLLLKFWTGGMICYCFIWGLSTFTLNQWDHLLVLGIALGTVTHLITNNILRFIAATPGLYDRWMMFPCGKIWLLPLDILYALLLVFCVVMTYNGINLIAAGSAQDAPAALGVEPILFGVIMTMWDLLFLGMKHLFKRMLTDAKRKVNSGK